jgi:glycosyl transferase family 2
MTLRPGITACVAAHPARFNNRLLLRALDSITNQTLQPDAILVVNDKDKHGAGWTRRTILSQINTEWLAWLDSDDYWYDDHLEKLWKVQQDTDSVYVYSWFDAKYDPLGHFGKVFNVCAPHHTTIVALVNTALAQEVGFRDSMEGSPYSEEDWGFIAKFCELACERELKITHLAERTWFWEQGLQNTCGQPNKGDAAR